MLARMDKSARTAAPNDRNRGPRGIRDWSEVMKTELIHLSFPRLGLLLSAFALLAAHPARAQVPVDETGQPLEAVEQPAPGAAAEVASETPVYTDEELEALVGPIALYPDDLLAIVLPASTYPLEIVQAARFLEQLENDSSLKPDESWDDSVVALLNYPEVVEMMNEDLDWTWKLGEAVVAQQPDVIAAIERFRDRAYAAGNLKSDGYQTVERNDEGAIEIDTVEDEIIYVPYYQPERVVVYQPRPVYYYYPQAYPVYYYPYPAHYSFASGYFWGVTTAFRIGWSSHHLHVFHHSYWGHPYYGRHYFGHWYRQPSISIFNSYYVNHDLRRSRHHHRDGDFWRPRRIGGPRPGHYRERVARYREPRLERTREGYRDGRTAGTRQIARNSDLARRLDSRAGFRGEAANRDTANNAPQRRGFAASRDRAERRAGSGDNDTAIRFRPRQRNAGESPAVTAPRSADRRAAENRSVLRSREAAPSDRGTTARERNRASDLNRRADPPARTSRPPTNRAVPRVTAPRSSATPRLSAPRSSSPSRTARPSSPQRAYAPRASAPRASAPRASAPRASAPRASAPRASAPRASAPRASAPRASAPRQASRSAPARQSRAAAPSQRSSGARSRNGARVRQH
jgi:hypothetical protein